MPLARLPRSLLNLTCFLNIHLKISSTSSSIHHPLVRIYSITEKFFFDNSVLFVYSYHWQRKLSANDYGPAGTSRQEEEEDHLCQRKLRSH